ncbi:MAG: hypothetical protein ACK5UE_06485 [Chitinophagales bacterium]
MNQKRINVSDGIYINCVNDFYNILVVEKYVNKENFSILKATRDYKVKHVVCDVNVNQSLFESLIEVESFVFINNNKFEGSFLHIVKNLRGFCCENLPELNIDWQLLGNLEEVDIPWSQLISFKHSVNLRHLILRKINHNNLDLILPENLEYLQLIQGKINSIEGLSICRSLKAVVLYSLKNIEDFSPLNKLISLEFIHLYNCKVLDLSFLSVLVNLKWVVLENCGDIHSLKPIHKLKGIEGIKLIGKTKIVDNDLSLVNLKTNFKYRYPYYGLKAEYGQPPSGRY